MSISRFISAVNTGQVKVMTYGYPIDSDGNPIKPSLLEAHSGNTMCPQSYCWCSLPCRFFQVRRGDLVGKHAFACYHRPGHKSCSLFVVVDEILESPNILYHEYSPLKMPEDPQPIAPLCGKAISIPSSSGSGSSQAGASFDPDMPVLVAPPHRQVISISSSSSSSLGQPEAIPLSKCRPTLQSKAKECFPSPRMFLASWAVIYSSGTPFWRGSQPAASTSTDNVKHKDSPPVVSGSSSDPSDPKWYRNFTYSGYSLPHPKPDGAGTYHKALALWTLPLGDTTNLRLSPIPHVTPTHGAAKVERDLLSPDGVPAHELWNLWEACPSCERVIFGLKLRLHIICDLTHL
ncbi:hypothetical protein FIBSPDRAFT_962397 [Athelia psychrophila]|uniref:Uncharacterized protein n=1 Tax=Athelia psychrophila TaxID=1759441 RepID=A0A166A6J4_9AGAM|nr:hypothetical protein FIBSPDRAFT_962397 [Fibularhizoctonia sp. CBS 109695]